MKYSTKNRNTSISFFDHARGETPPSFGLLRAITTGAKWIRSGISFYVDVSNTREECFPGSTFFDYLDIARNEGVFLHDEHRSSGVLGEERGSLGGGEVLLVRPFRFPLTGMQNFTLVEAHREKLFVGVD